MTARVGINGFGRAGRAAFRAINAYHRDTLITTAVNGPDEADIKAHLLKWDSTYGKFPGTVEVDGDSMIVNGDRVKTYSDRNPRNIPWGECGVDIVIDCTGSHKSADLVVPHIENGAKKVIISAPAKDDVTTIVLGVNEDTYDPEEHDIVSMASCTTNCAAQVAGILHGNFGIKRACITTVHAYTTDQHLLDKNHKDFRRARAASNNIIPTTTGAARLIGRIIPELEGRIDGMAIRVPVPVVSVVDCVADLEQTVSIDTINRAFKESAEGRLNGILEYCEEELVSSDYIGNSASAIFDAKSTMIIDDRMVKVLAWYDNEWGYSSRLAELAAFIAKKGF